jgi:hypothetical protein
LKQSETWGNIPKFPDTALQPLGVRENTAIQSPKLKMPSVSATAIEIVAGAAKAEAQVIEILKVSAGLRRFKQLVPVPKTIARTALANKVWPLLLELLAHAKVPTSTLKCMCTSMGRGDRSDFCRMLCLTASV